MALVLAVAVLLAIGLGGVAAVVRQQRHQAAQRRAAARLVGAAHTTVTGWLGDWARGDSAAQVAATAAAPAGLAAALTRDRRALQVVSARYTPGTVVTTGSDPGADVAAAVVLRGLGTWSYRTRLHLARSGSGWKVAWSPQTLHPLLRAGETLGRTRRPSTRGALVSAQGTSIRDNDTDLTENVLGTVGTLSAERAAAAGPAFSAGDLGGLTGLERLDNAALGGQPGGSVVALDTGGRVARTLATFASRPGKDVRTTFDLRVQQAGEQALAGSVLPGAVVALDVRTGEVRALVSHPVIGISRPVNGRYAPGSTFKVVTATAALMSGRTEATPLPCAASVTVDGETFVNAEKESAGTVDLRTAFARSCNTAFISLEAGLPKGAVAAAARLYGFGSDPGERGPLVIRSFGGSYPPPVDGAAAAAQAIGQGEDLASPLQMASVAAAVAAGAWRQPHLTPGQHVVSHALPARVAASLRAMMAAVVAPGGTAAGRGLPAGTAGKTGTAEYGTQRPPLTTAWFIGFRGSLAFAVVVGGEGTSAGFGGDVAAPVAARFLAALR